MSSVVTFMTRHTRLLAAALTSVGVAGLAFALGGLLSGSDGAASDDPLIFAVGEAPAPVERRAQPSDAETAILFPDLPEERDAFAPSGSGNLTPGAGGPSDAETLGKADGPKPDAGDSNEGVRQVREAGISPTALRIPEIGVEAQVVAVGTNSAGAMEAPRRYAEVGWWSPGAQPGEAGRAVMAGHVDSPWGPAVFIDLDELEPGDEIFVSDGATELRYIVRGVALYRADAAPTEEIFGPSAERELVLITCGGQFDPRTASYVHRRVIFAVLAEDSSNVAPVELSREIDEDREKPSRWTRPLPL